MTAQNQVVANLVLLDGAFVFFGNVAADIIKFFFSLSPLNSW